MPLRDHIPRIDDRTFEQLRQEVLTRIPRYTPEWTDFNDSDPGIAITQVFAWMTELLTYRMSKTPELNYLKFLQLIGVELNAAAPATAEITFPLVAGFPDASTIIPARTQVSAQPPGGGKPLVFETDRALVAVASTLTNVVVFDGYSTTPVTAQNAGATEPFAPFGPLTQPDSALLLGFDGGVDFPKTEMDLAVWVAGDAVTPVNRPPTPAGASTIAWEYRVGTQWLGLAVRKDETADFTRSGHVVLRLPRDGTLLPTSLPGDSVKFYWLRARLEQNQYAKPPMLVAIRTNTVSATQAETAQDELLGGSDGRPDQTFTLANTPVVAGSLRLEIDQGEGFGPWTEVDDLLASGPADTHFTLDRTTGETRFGDGVNGAIPVANPSNPDANVVARLYRAGGTSAGNLAAGLIKNLTTGVVGVDDNAVGNLFASVGGRDEETLDAAKLRARGAIRSHDRAVTAQDYETLAAQASDIRRAKALPLVHPDFPGIQVPGAVTVIVVPDAVTDRDNPAYNPKPVPSDAMLRQVRAYLDRRRLLTTELYVIGPTYQEVSVQADVVADDTADTAAVNEQIDAALLTYFHPLLGGDDDAGWPFGGTIYFSLVYQRLLRVPGVRSVKDLTILLDRQPAPPCTDVEIRPEALVYSTHHDAVARYAD